MNPDGLRAPPPEDSPPRESRFLLLGLGNELCSDDAIGLLVVRQLRRVAESADDALPHPFDIRETTGAGLALLDELTGYEEAILVDAVRTGHAPAGHVHLLDGRELPRVTLASPHFLGVGETLVLGHALGLPMPARVRVVAIEVDDPYTIGTRLSPPLAAALPDIVRTVARLLREFAPDPSTSPSSGPF
jgi:hydrogenase maturation protease